MSRIKIERHDGVTLEGTDSQGCGPTVLLLHAGGERRQVWDPVVEMLGGLGVRCVAFDQRGHGASGGEAIRLAEFADDVAAIVDVIGDPALVVGSSLGGLAPLWTLRNEGFEGKLAGLVLVDVVPDPDRERTHAFLRATTGLEENPLVGDILDRGEELRSVSSRLALPVMLIRGGRRSPLSDDDEARLLALVPHAVVREVPEAGHLIAEDAPRALAGYIAEFLRSPPVAARLGEDG